MAIVSFWSRGKGETGKTSAIIALATHMAIEHNYKILVISTAYNDSTIKNAFWKEEKKKKNLGIFGPNTGVSLQNGVEGLNRYIRSNKVSPDIITNYTKIVFKDRLEILPGYEGDRDYYNEIKNTYSTIIDLANKCYDIVIVDIDSDIGEEVEKILLYNSDVIVTVIPQRLTYLNNYIEARAKNQVLNSAKNIILIGRFDKFSKYNTKNVTRFLKEKNEVNCIPYNTLFFEACEEAKVIELILRLRRIHDETDKNAIFIKEIKRLSENILYRLKNLQMR